ncbi:ribose-phosphate diphosphokinase [Methanoplanus endosymbiosus]|uniref:Ribose-phosphate pyrophosphokinase n=1 Tax=Methanoplanus endosymbiosus TaxID=33865 RepID=A0A9E7PP84_9EURY|nr:ribose-phosphate diphosphokinase [Methanoplanus endosymbiosus]UUX91117.1 ribose-phosphate diphosphokinase [Methanoplanus endosymbiosus]
MKIIGNEKSQVLAAKTAGILGAELLPVEFRKFPDGELFLRAEGIGNEITIIGSIVDSDSFVQLLLLIDACEGAEITLVIPYMGYARQDKKFHEGEPVSSRAIAGALSRNVSKIYTINIHEESVLNFFDTDAENLSLAPYMGRYIKELGLENPLILGPDGGAAEFAKAVAGENGWDSDHLVKTRLSGTEVRIEPKTVEAKGREVVFVDDIIATGGTLANAASMLMNQGAAGVHAACVHGVFAKGGYSKLCSSGLKSVVSADTIESASSVISAAQCIADALRK